ncbi:hypothetical protein LR48_Vigan06g116600 [Vigna angularis]|uniref:Secreted protein n=1 Tax=Phaseolus angularis TaxID=3914 RepID=A0A0L9USK2_PHAAN|nr:hypothetical protein LR48_Vigan06g116600 [Vigna angularis]
MASRVVVVVYAICPLCRAAVNREPEGLNGYGISVWSSTDTDIRRRIWVSVEAATSGPPNHLLPPLLRSCYLQTKIHQHQQNARTTQYE